MKRIVSCGMGLAAWGALACATPANRNLERAEIEYESAAANPQVASYAPAQLREAERSLAEAQRAFRDDRDDEDVDHLAYLATRRVEIARATAVRNQAIARVGAVDAPGPVIRTRPDAALVAELAALLSALRAEETDRGILVTVDDVRFDRERATLRTDALPDLSRLADFLRAHPELDVIIEGHADAAERERGSVDLSLDRAEAVEDYLVAQGIEPSRIVTRGYGASDPVIASGSAYGHRQNRRVEILVVE